MNELRILLVQLDMVEELSEGDINKWLDSKPSDKRTDYLTWLLRCKITAEGLLKLDLMCDIKDIHISRITNLIKVLNGE